MNQDEFRACARAEGFAEPVLVDRDASYGLEGHQHSFEAFVLILEGAFSLKIDSVERCYRAGETFRLPAGTHHHEWAGPKGARYLAARKEQVQA